MGTDRFLELLNKDRANLRAAFEAAEIESKFSDDVGGEKARRKNAFMGFAPREATSKGSDMDEAEKVARRLVENAENTRVLAEELGASSSDLEGDFSTDETDEAKAAFFGVPELDSSASAETAKAEFFGVDSGRN